MTLWSYFGAFPPGLVMTHGVSAFAFVADLVRTRRGPYADCPRAILIASHMVGKRVSGFTVTGTSRVQWSS